MCVIVSEGLSSLSALLGLVLLYHSPSNVILMINNQRGVVVFTAWFLVSISSAVSDGDPRPSNVSITVHDSSLLRFSTTPPGV